GAAPPCSDVRMLACSWLWSQRCGSGGPQCCRPGLRHSSQRQPLARPGSRRRARESRQHRAVMGSTRISYGPGARRGSPVTTPVRPAAHAMCILGQDGAVASTRDADMPRPDEWLTEAAPHRSKVGRLALDAPLVGAVATPSSHTPRSDTSLSSQAPTGTTTAHGGDSDFVETPRSEVGVPRAECCWQPTDVPGAGAPPAAVWCWQPVAFGQQHAGHAEGWQYGQPQPQALFCVGQFAAQFAAGAQLGAQQCEAFGGATPAPAQRRRRGGGRPAPAPRAPAADGPGGSGGGTSGKSEGGGGSAPQQGRQRAQRGVRSGKRPPPPPPPAFDAAWCEARLAELEGDAGARGGALAAVCGHALQLSFDKAGTRLVQRALEVAGREARDALLAELSGHAVER
ncbi:unnamed protein product, partial [Prorocentrum cordatum]